MSVANEKAPGAANNRGSNQNTNGSNSAQVCCAHKWQRTLMALLDGPKNSFELEKHPTFDHCPNSTISELKKRYGLIIHAQLVRVAGYANQGAHIAQYTLSETSRDKAMRLLGLA